MSESGPGAADERTEEPEIPANLAAAWGLRPRPGKGPKPALSVGRIVSAAIQTAVKDGLSAVSMNRVASELGTAAMSLYRHVSGKDELLSLMVDEAYGPPPADLPRPGEDWRSGLSRWAWSTRERQRAHLWAVNVPVSGPPITPNQVRWMEAGLQCLGDSGLDPEEKLGVILLVSGFIRNEVQLTAQLTAAMERSGKPEVLTGYAQLLRSLIDPERFPATLEVIDAGVLDADDGSDYDFEFGLERILDGIEKLIDAR